MLVGRVLNTEVNMNEIVYIRLLNEGVLVYRPVPAMRVTSDVYVVGGADIYDPEDETWEFPPGAHVVVQKRAIESGGEAVLIATGNA